MNYYAQGGQAHGLKSLAKELPNYGRYNDDMVAHISSDEARLLKSLGGAGTINPVTGLPEYGLKKLARAIEKPFRSSGVIGGALKPIIEPVRDVIQDLGPVATIAATYFGGPLGAGVVGGLSGQKGFDFKRALLSGALAYGAQNLAQGISGSSDAALSSATDVAAPAVSDVASSLGADVGTNVATGYGSQAAMLAEQAAGFGDAGLANIASSASYGFDPAANLVGAAADTTAGMADAYAAGNQSIYDKGIQSLTDVGSKLGTDIKNLGSGAYNLASGDPAAINAFKASGATMTNTALPILLGYSGVAAIDEAEKYQNEADLANAKSQEEYDAIMARINDGRRRAEEAVRNNPYQFAVGGQVDDEAGMDEARGLYQGNMSNGFMSGGMPVHNVAMSEMSQPTVNNGAVGIQQFAAGGQPRFLSGGGDGMSDSIKAKINGTQEARLADGEFVIPADVVSHLGNGSSKAGAKQLYSMMDKVRTARTGNKKQGKQINPAKYMPA